MFEHNKTLGISYAGPVLSRFDIFFQIEPTPKEATSSVYGTHQSKLTLSIVAACV